MKRVKLYEDFISEANKGKVHRAAKQGSYPAVVVVVQDGKVIHQEPVSTPEVAPATFNVMQEKYPKALIHLEDKTGKRLFSESVVTEEVVYNSSNTKPEAAKKAKKEFGKLLPKPNKGVEPYEFAVVKTKSRNYRLAIKSGSYVAHEFMTNIKDDGILTADIVKKAVANIIKLNPEEFNESVVTEAMFSVKDLKEPGLIWWYNKEGDKAQVTKIDKIDNLNFPRAKDAPKDFDISWGMGTLDDWIEKTGEKNPKVGEVYDIAESVVTEAKNTIGLAFKSEDDYNGFVEFIEDEGGKIFKNIGWDHKTKSWEVIMDTSVLDDIYGEGHPGNKESGWYGALPTDFESVIIEGFVSEAFIGPFVFNDTMSDEELKAMYDGALDGYANWQKGFQHPKAKYKQAYQEIEKLLKKRGVEESVVTEAKMDREKIEGILWDLENSNKLSNPSDPKKKAELIKKLKKQLDSLKESVVNEHSSQDSRELNEGELNSKVAKKLTIGDTIKTDKHTYTITDFGQKANAFRQFQVEDEAGEIYQIQVSLYGSNSIGVGAGRSLNFRDEVLESLVTEAKSQIKRKYGQYKAINVYEKASIRNGVLRFVGKRFVTEDELKMQLTRISEDRGKSIDQRKWLQRNMKYFESTTNRGQNVLTLSKYGSRIFERILKLDTKENKLAINESIGLFKKSFLNEAQDINDPVLIAIIANKYDREKKLAMAIQKKRPLYGKERTKAQDQLWDISQELKDLYDERANLYIDMESDAGEMGMEEF